MLTSQRLIPPSLLKSSSLQSRQRGEDEEVVEIKVCPPPSDWPTVNPVDHSAFLRKRLNLASAVVALSPESTVTPQDSASSIQTQSHASSKPSQLGSQVVAIVDPEHVYPITPICLHLMYEDVRLRSSNDDNSSRM